MGDTAEDSGSGSYCCRFLEERPSALELFPVFIRLCRSKPESKVLGVYIQYPVEKEAVPL